MTQPTVTLNPISVFVPAVQVDPNHADVIWHLWHPERGWASTGDFFNCEGVKFVGSNPIADAEAVLTLYTDRRGQYSDICVTSLGIHETFAVIQDAVAFIKENYQGCKVSLVCENIKNKPGSPEYCR